jgi:CheY-like chemotaxis protein
VASNDVSLILSDINMPNIDGLELFIKLRETPKWKQLSVVMITTSVAGLRSWRLSSFGARGYVRELEFS